MIERDAEDSTDLLPSDRMAESALWGLSQSLVCRWVARRSWYGGERRW
jgi:hypothetical protein